jgi:hypothetical protein
MSKKKGILRALTGLTLLLWLFSGSIGNDQVSNYPDERYEIKLKSRSFIPEEGMPISLAVMGVEPYKAKSHLLMQFNEIPDRETRNVLEGLGVKFLNYIPNRSWFVSVPSDVSFDFLAMSGVRWVGSILPDDKLYSTVRAAASGDMRLIKDGKVELTVKYFDDADPIGLRSRLESAGVEVIYESAPLKSVFIAALPEQIYSIAGDDEVRWIEPIGPPFKPESNRVRTHIQVDPAQSAGFTGDGIAIGVFDWGHASNTHGDLVGRVTLADTPGQPTRIQHHSTMVAGMAGGNGSQSAAQPCGYAQRWKGMAPGVSIYSYDYDDVSNAAMRTNFSNDLLDAITFHDIEIAANSWGTSGCTEFSYGDYVGLSPFLDEQVYYSGYTTSKPRIIVFSAGNERDLAVCGNSTTPPYINYGTMNHPKSAKNIIAVGAIDSANNLMTSYSSWGPTTDGRIKPEIVASGQHNGTNSSGVSTITNQYGTSPCYADGQFYRTPGTSGGYVYGWFGMTSNAAAATVGAIALLLEDYYDVHVSPPPLASTIKAALIQTAQDLDDATSWYNKGPDYASGYGLINTNAARLLLHNSQFVIGQLDPDQPNWPRDVTYRFTVPAGASSVKVTLAWDDYPAADNADPALVNDLDLVLHNPNGTAYYPWTLDPGNPSVPATRLSEDHINNVEQVYVDSGIVSGIWTATVIAETIPTHPQAFSLAGYVFSTCPRPAQPTISYPSVDCDYSYTVSWTSVPGATSYEYQWDDNPEFSSPVGPISTTGTYINIVPPAGNHVYYYRVRSKNECGTSFWEEGGPIVIGSPPIVTDPYPPDGTGNVPIGTDLDWTSSPGTDSYDVYIGTTSPPPFAANVTYSTYDPGTLSAATVYYWRVNPKNTCGGTSGPIWSFTTEGGVTGPQITGISPSKASAGTNTEVTVSGLNFGSTQGTSKVEFFYRSGYSKKEASIVSWSATQIKCRVPKDASSGPVTVTTSSGTSNEYTFRVSFGYKGVFWPGAHPNVTFRVNENAPDCTGEAAAVIAAANAWNGTGSDFTYVYGGTTTATTPSQNGINEIFWGTVSTGALASFSLWYVNTNQLVEFDMVLNDTFPWSTNAESGHHDIQNVLTALFGYNLGLTLLFGDVGGGDDTEKTMYYWANLGETYKRTLHADDIAGVQWIYGVSGAVRVDFNNDGQEDILWRYYGAGGYNRVWFLGDSGPTGLKVLTADGQKESGRISSGMIGDGASGKTAKPLQYLGIFPDKKKTPVTRVPRDLMGGAKRSARQIIIADPRRAGGRSIELSSESVADPRQVKSDSASTAASDTPLVLASTPILLGGADVMPVADLNWRIVGTGDFNNDAHVDILWRNISTGSNVVWFMNGAEWTASTELIPVADLSWKIVGTGDFNKDGHVDILWRNWGPSGSNVVWYMNGTTWIGSAVLLGVSDSSWRIVGTGDFNKDGSVDILWRYDGPGGANVVWYMNGASWIGSAELISVPGYVWTIAGTGDYNNDGNVDILWRYDNMGGYNYIWYMNGVTWIGGGDLLPVADLSWVIVSR